MPPRANAACAAAGISRAALYHWLKNDPRFTAHYESLQAVYYPPWIFCPGALNDPNLEPARTYSRKQQRAGRRLICSYQNRQAQR